MLKVRIIEFFLCIKCTIHLGFFFSSAVTEQNWNTDSKFVNNITGTKNVLIGDHITATIGSSSTDGKKSRIVHLYIVPLVAF